MGRPAPAKKPKVAPVPWADIERAINDSGLEQDSKEILIEVLPFSLGEYAERRHKFQESVVSTIGQVLKELEDGFAGGVKAALTEVEKFTLDEPRKQAGAAEAQKDSEEKRLTEKNAKDSLVVAAVDFRASRKALQDAEIAQQSAQAAIKVAQTSAQELESMKAMMQDLDNFPETPEAEQKILALIAMLKTYDFEQSMLVALPSTLGKSKEARGRFGDIVINGLADELQRRFAEQDSLVKSAEDELAKHAAAVAGAQDQFQKAQDNQLDTAEAWEGASKELAAALAAATTAQKTLNASAANLRKLTKAQNIAEAELDVFRQDALATFERLRQQIEPQQEPEEPIGEQATETTETRLEEEQAAHEVVKPILAKGTAVVLRGESGTISRIDYEGESYEINMGGERFVNVMFESSSLRAIEEAISV
jgi:hypothetical protein